VIRFWWKAMAKPHLRKLVRTKREHDGANRAQRIWEEILTEAGVSMNRGLSDKLSYVGGFKELGVLEKVQKMAKG